MNEITREDIYNWAKENRRKVFDGKPVSNIDVAITSFILTIMANKQKIIEKVEESSLTKRETLEEALKEDIF